MRKAILLGVVAVLLGIAQPARAQFCPGVSPWVFDDVAASDPFCGFITWMAENGITLGCQVIDANHRLYCPNANVSRAAMAAFMNRLGNVRVEAVGTGPGLTGGPITSTGTINLAATQLLPTTACASGQIPQWNGSAWACANAVGGGTVTSVGSGTGLAGGPVTTSGTLSIATGYQLPQGCANGQVAKSNGSGGWTCASDATGAGTVTSVATGAGLTGGPITGSGTIDLAATQLLPTAACGNGQVPSWTGSAWACVTPGNFSGNINLQDSTASVGNITKPGGAFFHNFGNGNVFAGVNAGNFAMTGVSNAGFGFRALQNNGAANNNTAVGAYTLQVNTTGAANTATGAFALNGNTTAFNNTATGAFALRFNTTGGANTATGTFALGSNTTGGNNAALGAGALGSNTTGSYNIAIGPGAMTFNVVGSGSTAIGVNALANNLVDNSTAVGRESLAQNTTGVNNTGVGFSALYSNTTGQNNTAVGFVALTTNTGNENTAVGSVALAQNTTGSYNAALGNVALANNTTGSNNTGIGRGALALNTTGIANTALGSNALNSNTIASTNTAVGNSSLLANVNGDGNTAIGHNALVATTFGGYNTAVGRDALSGNTGGGQNIAIGQLAGSAVTTGNWNIHIGNQGVSGDGNTIRVGDNNHSRAFVAGIRGVTTGANNAINVVIDGNGQLGTLSSSREVKDDIADIGTASEVLMKLHPVSFRYKAHEGAGPVQYGLIAEEVAEVAPGLVATGSNGEIETVLYQHLPPMLLNEYQKQQHTIETQARRIDAQQAEIAELKRAVEVLLARTSPEGRIAAK